MRYSRILPGPRYLTSTAVLISEVLKCLISVIIYLRQEYLRAKEQPLPPLSKNSIANEITSRFKLRQIIGNVFGAKSGVFKIFISAVLYTLQNNLQFIAASNLDAAVFQVTYQCKILTTAIFTVIILRQSLSIRKWISLLLLTLGTALVQLPSLSSTRGEGDWLIGIISVTIACICSGLAGVYFEKTLKGNTASLWVRNIQLSSVGIILAAVGALAWDWNIIMIGGFFQGYNTIVAMTIAIQAGGGLIVAIVIKYADNILKVPISYSSHRVLQLCDRSSNFFPYRVLQHHCQSLYP